MRLFSRRSRGGWVALATEATSSTGSCGKLPPRPDVAGARCGDKTKVAGTGPGHEAWATSSGRFLPKPIKRRRLHKGHSRALSAGARPGRAVALRDEATAAAAARGNLANGRGRVQR